MITIDGSEGEGGGQILRTSLSLAMCTGQPFRIVNIRAKRPKPGLLRQHLTALNAAAEICSAQVSSGALGSQTLEFSPGTIRGGDYRFAIGTAGSCTLVLQTVLPALLQAAAPSTLTLQGGTHNPHAPPFDFLQRAFVPLLARMGVRVDLTLKRHGFYPAGGGEVLAEITPGPLQPIELEARGARVHGYAEALSAAVPTHVAQRELETLGAALSWPREQLLERRLPNEQGPGNALMVTLEHEHVNEVFIAFGERGLKAEAVAHHAARQAREYLASTALAGEHFADQLLLPMALAGGGSFTASTLSQHFVTNVRTIRRFLPVQIVTETRAANNHRVVLHKL